MNLFKKKLIFHFYFILLEMASLNLCLNKYENVKPFFLLMCERDNNAQYRQIFLTNYC